MSELPSDSNNPLSWLMPIDLYQSISPRLGIPIQRLSFGFDAGRLDIDYYHKKGCEISITLMNGDTYTIHVDKAVMELGKNFGIDATMLTEILSKQMTFYQGNVPQNETD